MAHFLKKNNMLTVFSLVTLLTKIISLICRGGTLASSTHCLTPKRSFQQVIQPDFREIAAA